MEDAKGQVVGSAAEVYDQFFVPALFAEWAPRVAEAAAVGDGDRVVDVACGTGVLAREAARRAGLDRVSGVDCNAGMLAVARATEPRIDWREGRAEALPFDDGQVDRVVSQFGLMFFDDRAGALAEMWRLLRPGGRLAVAVWGPLEDTPGYAEMVVLLSRLFGGAIADELRAPYCLGDRDALGALFDRAGIAGAEIATAVGRARFASLADWVDTDIRGWTLADRIDDDQLALLQREAEVALARFVTDSGVAFDAPAHIVTARK
jgi:SAM-dependent methyltransferase